MLGCEYTQLFYLAIGVPRFDNSDSRRDAYTTPASAIDFVERRRRPGQASSLVVSKLHR